VNSNDIKEVGDPNWQRILGIPALEDIARYLNLTGSSWNGAVGSDAPSAATDRGVRVFSYSS
jgi:hypothetical protein